MYHKVIILEQVKNKILKETVKLNKNTGNIAGLLEKVNNLAFYNKKIIVV